MKDIIREKGFVSHSMRVNEFKHLSILEIRDWLEANGLPRTLAIESYSTEIAICTPEGVLMQVRSADKNALGMWGGCVDPKESPAACAVRELFEETCIQVKEEALDFVELNTHTHTYSNGNEGIFHAYRYLLKLNDVPEVRIDYESTGFYLVNSLEDIERVLDHQKDFILNLVKRMQESG